jgi:DNA primase
VAKYVNSPETEIYVKSKSLYGIYFAKGEISRKDKCILVEGYLDVLSMHQLGIQNVVASSGTSLTVEQIRLIHKFTDNVTIIYDGDGAGIHAALRGIDLVLKEGMNVKIVLLPDGQDPDDFAKKHTLEEVQDYIAQNERDFIGFKSDLLLDQAGGDPLKKAELINDVADSVSLMPDPVKRAVYVRSCAEKFAIDESILTERVSRKRADMILSEQKQAERERQRAAVVNVPEDVPPPPMPDDYMDYADPVHEVIPSAPVDGVLIDNPLLAPCEKELLGFILEDGCSTLRFDRDSKFFVADETVNVAEFIDGALNGDPFGNQSYRKVYDEYFRMYDEGLGQQQIQTRLLNSQDMVIASVAKELLIEKYQITVKAFEDSLTTNDTRLVMYVPKCLMTYQCRKLEEMVKELSEQLEAEKDLQKQIEIIARISDCNRARTRLNNELGRV